jgi:mono/diheme cytochrome c family protein
MRYKTLWWTVGILAGLGIAIQLIPYGRVHSVGPVRREPAWDRPETRALLARACFDCHSNQTVWPWYAAVAPVSWLLQHDVDDGRRHVNFSEWNRLQRGLRGVRNDVMGGKMPPWYYLPFHPRARLSDAEKENLLHGLAATIANDPPPQPPPRRAGDRASKPVG